MNPQLRISPASAIVAACSLAAALLAPVCLASQDRPVATPLPQWELRADWIEATRAATHAGVGVNVRAGWYARVGTALALGAARRADGEWIASQRLDVTARFLLDPFDEQRVGIYGGAGITARHDADSPVDARLLMLLGIEGRARRGILPAVELGLGGGIRLGVVLRRRRAGSAR